MDDSGLTQNVGNAVSSYITLAAGGSSGVSASYTFSSAGTYQVRACANQNSAGTNIVTESNYGNNCGAWTSVTVSGSGADLTAGNTSLSDSTPTAGTAVTLSATASNLGDQASGSFPVLFQVQDSANTDVGLVDSSYLAGLAPSASAPASVSYTFSSAGTYQVRACANENTSKVNIVTESNYGNNCGAWKSVTVSAPPLSLTCTVNNPSPTPGQTVTYTANGGGASDRYGWKAADAWDATAFQGPTLTRTFTAVGSYGMQVTDKTGNNQTAQCPVVTVGCGSASGTISANPTRVRSGGTATLTWSASGVNTSCVVSGPGVNKTDPANSCAVGNDSLQTPGITAQSVYTITCDGVKQGQVIVNVIPEFQEF